MDKFRILFNNLMQGILIINSDGIIEEVNNTAVEILGTDKDAITGVSVMDSRWNVVDENFNKIAAKDFPAILAIKSKKDIKNKVFGIFNKPLQKYVWINVSAVPVKLDQDETEKIILSLSDISEIFEKEQELQKSNERFQTSIETLPIPFVIFKALRDENNKIYDFEFTYVNDETVKVNQISRENTIGKTMLQLHPGHKESGVFEGFVKTVETGEPFVKKEVFYEGEFRNSLYKGYFEIRALKFEDGAITIWQEITNKKEYEKYLEYHTKVVENLSEGVILMDKESNILAYNNAAENILGYSYEEIKKDSVRDLLKLINLEPPSLEILKKISKEGFYKTETEITAKDGTVKDVESTTFALRDEGGIIGYGNLIRDITEQKAYEENITKSETQFRTLAENSLDVIARLDTDLKYIYINSRVEEITGIPRKDRIGKSVEEFTKNLNDGKKLLEKFKLVLETKQPAYTEYDYSVGDKKYYFSMFIIPEFDSEHIKIVSLIYVSRDITESYKSKQAVTDAYHYAQSILNTIYDPLMVFDLNLELISANESFYKTFGVKKSEAPGKEFKELIKISGEDKSVIQKITRIAEGKEVERIELRVDTGSSVFRIMNLKAVPLSQRSKNSPLILISLHDITELKIADKKSLKLIKELERSNQELEQFAYVASHDLQEPLRMVHGYTSLLAERYKDKLDSDASEFIDYASEGATRMQDLIRDLLDFSKVREESREPEKVNTSEVIEEVLDNLKFTIEDEKPEINYPKLPAVYGSKENLIRLFQNLILNSIKYRSEEPLKINITFEKEGEFIKFAVTDNGIGISKKNYERIFKIFQRLHNRSKNSGTGIGLSICKRIVENEGGRIWVESALGIGTTFYFTLPQKKQIDILGLMDGKENFTHLIN